MTVTVHRKTRKKFSFTSASWAI